MERLLPIGLRLDLYFVGEQLMDGRFWAVFLYFLLMAFMINLIVGAI